MESGHWSDSSFPATAHSSPQHVLFRFSFIHTVSQKLQCIGGNFEFFSNRSVTSLPPRLPLDCSQLWIGRTAARDPQAGDLCQRGTLGWISNVICSLADSTCPVYDTAAELLLVATQTRIVLRGSGFDTRRDHRHWHLVHRRDRFFLSQSRTPVLCVVTDFLLISCAVAAQFSIFLASAPSQASRCFALLAPFILRTAQLLSH